ncbi:MAG: hypothetical protein HKO64_02015 [Xanthomonadales bacterium]|nr:hypothetical protein [Gammaproteobacteria bacterium]NNL94377.1 hypothetical protein [Xanthomonadales bacterium]
MKQKMRIMVRVAFTVALILACNQVMAQSAVLTIASDPSQVNHYPGPDGLIGNGDDVISASNSTVQNSSPNSIGSYGFNAFLFQPFGPADPAMPAGFDAITFVNGAVTIDKGVFASGGGPIVSALTITSGTEPFPGHGAYTSTITAVNSGTYNQLTGEFTLNVDFSYTINGSTSNEPGVVLTGTALYQEAADFGTDTGNTYFEGVAKPLAQAKGASGVVFMTGTGTLTNLGFPINATIVALEGVGVTINAGMNDAWVSADAPFQGLFFTVFEDLGLLFLSWFTFDSQIQANNNATFGASDQRWVTGLGNYNGNTVIMSVELTSGGIFNGSDPLAGQTANYGTISIIFISCNEAVLSYNFPGPGLTGQMTLTRVVPDNVPLCEMLSQ